MKTLKMKKIIFTSLVTAIATIGLSETVIAQTTALTSATLYITNHEKSAINKDIAMINMQQHKVKMLQTEAMQQKKAGVKTCSTRADLSKANADLNRQKAYLKADKDEYFGKQQAVITQREKTIKRERMDLLYAELKMPALIKDKTVRQQKQQAIADQKFNLTVNTLTLKQWITERNNTLLALNKQIKSADGESAVMLAFENGYAKTQNIAMK